MASRKTNADRIFEKKVKDAISQKDWARVTLIFTQYGHYLELLEEQLAPQEQS